MAVRKDNTTGLEYKRSLTDDEQKTLAAASINRIYSIASYVFVIGIIAVGALCAISIINKSPTAAIICEATVFLCLIMLLVLVIRARRRMNEQRVQAERYPYSSVDKKEIDKIFDLIADEEKKRERLNIFASSGDAAASGQMPAAEERMVRKENRDPVPKKEVPQKPDNDADDAVPEQQEEEEMVSVLEDELNDVEIRMKAMEAEEEGAAAEKPAEVSQPEEEAEAPRKEKRRKRPEGERPRNPERPGQRPAGKRPPQGASKGKKRPAGEGLRDPRDPRAQQGAKRRRPMPYDPYYDGAYYYDEYGRPIRRPPPYDPYYGGAYYYDEYGEPVRRREAPVGKERVYYDEYGNPIRRRPPAGYDPRREDAARRRRPGAPAQPGEDAVRRRPDAARPGSGKTEKKSRNPAAPIADPEKRTAAPVAMPSLKKDFDEEYVPVYIPYDEENDTAHDAERSGVALRADRGRRVGAPPAPPKPVMEDETDYSPSDLEAIPIVVDDDYNPDYGDEENFSSPATGARGAQSKAHSAPKNAPDYYYEDDSSPEEIDAGVVVVHDFDDIDEEEYEARYSRGFNSAASGSSSSPAAKKNTSYEVEEESYSYEEEDVVVLPRDENYEEYMQKVKEEEEKKRQEEEKRQAELQAEKRRLERKNSGKVALTIRRVRRKKIHRNSRKYKRFRASVVPLVKYLGVYDDK